MSRTSFRTLLVLVAVVALAALPALAIAHRGDSSGSAKTVGTVVSYSDGTLVVSSGGVPVAGKVTRRTKIRWVGRRHHHADDDRRGRDARASRRGSDDDDDDRDRDRGRGQDDGPGHDLGDDRRRGGRGATEGGLPTSGGMPKSDSRPKARLLTPGTIVRDADLRLTARGPVWVEIRLARPAATPAR